MKFIIINKATLPSESAEEQCNSMYQISLWFYKKSRGRWSEFKSCRNKTSVLRA